jgi:hypothetical protein
MTNDEIDAVCEAAEDRVDTALTGLRMDLAFKVLAVTLGRMVAVGGGDFAPTLDAVTAMARNSYAAAVPVVQAQWRAEAEAEAEAGTPSMTTDEFNAAPERVIARLMGGRP